MESQEVFRIKKSVLVNFTPNPVSVVKYLYTEENKSNHFDMCLLLHTERSKVIVMMNSRKKIVIAAALAAVMGLAGCSTNNERSGSFSYDYGYQNIPISIESGASDVSSSSDIETTSSSTSIEHSGDNIADSSSASSSASMPHIVCTVNIFDDDSDPDTETGSSSSSSGQSGNSGTSSTSGNNSKPSVVSVSGSVSAIKNICGIKSKVEKDISACIVNTYTDHNPYDVEYDYGKNYDSFVKTCDWSLVFDADFYIKSFPLLAMQYHNNKSLLLEHFQTIGIHEGRQGNKSFNVGVYMNNCDSSVKNAFGNNYEGYYFYYMLNYASEKSVNAASGSDSKLQQKAIMTALQSEELKGVNMYRREVGVADIAFDSELAAFANYRGYLNSHDGYKVHDWFRASENKTVLNYIVDLYNAQSLGENTATTNCESSTCHHPSCNYGRTYYENYRASEPHYKAMIASKNDLIGCGNCYKAPYVVSQFDTFIDL